MKHLTRKGVVEDLNKFCCFASDSEYIEITEWANGEGYDIDVSNDQVFRLTHGQLKAVNTLVGILESGIKEDEA